MSPPSNLPWRAAIYIDAFSTVHTVEYPEERDGITAADLDDLRDEEAAAKHSEWRMV
jgi:hypothetical protein